MKGKNAALERVLQHQNEIKAAEQTITTLEGAIATQRQAIQEVNSFTTNLPQLLQSREDLLADIAVGNSSKEALVPLNAQIESEQKVMDKHTANAAKLVPEAKATIAGLERKLEAARAELADLKGETRDHVHAFLMTEAERIGKEYSDAAMIVADRHRTLFAFDNLLRAYGASRGLRPVHGHELALPLFNLDAHRGLDNPTWPGQLGEVVKTKYDDKANSAALCAEKERIEALGVNL
jgi:hypothetical protein